MGRALVSAPDEGGGAPPPGPRSPRSASQRDARVNVRTPALIRSLPPCPHPPPCLRLAPPPSCLPASSRPPAVEVCCTMSRCPALYILARPFRGLHEPSKARIPGPLGPAAVARGSRIPAAAEPPARVGRLDPLHDIHDACRSVAEGGCVPAAAASSPRAL